MPPVTRRNAATRDIRDRPAYPLAEAARYLKVPPATLRSWFLGRKYQTADGSRQFRAIVKPASRKPPLLSFYNLIEAHVLRALRTDHGVSFPAVRGATRYAQGQLGLSRLFLSPELRADAGRLFLDRYGQLIELSASGQLALRQVLEAYLKRVEWDDSQFPIRLYPFLTAEPTTIERPIVIDAAIAFGRPIVLRRGISTGVIAERIDAGESVEALAEDYDLQSIDIEQAVLYERAA